MLKPYQVILDRGTRAILSVFLSDPRRRIFNYHAVRPRVSIAIFPVYSRFKVSNILPEIGTIRVSRMRLKTARLLTSGWQYTRAWCTVAGSGARSMQADNFGVRLQKFYITVEDWITHRLFFPAPTAAIIIIIIITINARNKSRLKKTHQYIRK